MSETEKQDLDRWLEWANGQVNTWRSRELGGVQKFEARVWKDGKALRAIQGDRHEAIRQVRDQYTAPVADVPRLGRCASCPQAAVAAVIVPVSPVQAVLTGLKTTGRPSKWHGPLWTDEEVPLCPRCMRDALQDRLNATTVPDDLAAWVKKMRAVGP